MVLSALPSRVTNLALARQRYGDRIDRLAPRFYETDPLADEAVAALQAEGWGALGPALARGPSAIPHAPSAVRALLESVWRVPDFVDRSRAARGGRVLLRAGVFGGIVLGARSLVAGYCSPAGNKPLVMTGALQGDRQGLRLAETGRYVAAVAEPDGLVPGGEAFRISVRVRLMHAKVRWLIRRDVPEWDVAAWGEPINQHDMLATSILFSEVLVDGLRRFGFRVTPTEAEDWLHLWRWAGWVMGVDPALLPVTEVEAVDLAQLILLTQGAPDDDARTLVRSLLRHSPRGTALAEGFCRGLLGDDLADDLHLRRTPLRHAVRVASLVVGPLDRLRSVSRRLDERAVRRGRRYWADAVELGRRGEALRYDPPGGLDGYSRG